MKTWWKNLNGILLASFLIFGVAACAPATEVTSANTTDSGIVAENAGGNAVAFVAPSNIAPANYVATYQDANADHILIDVREPYEYDSGHIAGSVNIPLGQLASRLDEVPMETQVIVYCRSGNRSTTAANLLADAGYSGVLNLGGVIQWENAGYGLE